jgi:hypothetical protein
MLKSTHDQLRGQRADSMVESGLLLGLRRWDLRLLRFGNGFAKFLDGRHFRFA